MDARLAELPVSAIRIRALRGVCGLSQKELERRSGLTREEISKIESGALKASSFRARQALASGLEVDLVRLAEYLDGQLSLEALVRATAAEA